MTMTADHTQSPIDAAQERVDAAVAEMTRLDEEFKALPAQEQEAIRAGDEDALLRLGARRKILQQRSREANITRAAAQYRLEQARTSAEHEKQPALSQAVQDAFAAVESIERALVEARWARGRAQGAMQGHLQRLGDLSRAEREAL